ncbi:MAG: YHS domain-containing protein [Leifsonia sp.]
MCEAHSHDTTITEEHSHSEPAEEGHFHSHSVDTVDETTAECPVMHGNFVDKADAEAKGLFRDYEGTRYYLCCAACGPLFDADPAKYVATV